MGSKETSEDSNPRTLCVKPGLLTIMRRAGIDLLAYDGAACSEAAGPLAEAARRIEADPDLCRQLRLLLPAGSQSDTSSDMVDGLRWAAELCTQHPAAPLRVKTWDDHGIYARLRAYVRIDTARDRVLETARRAEMSWPARPPGPTEASGR